MEQREKRHRTSADPLLEHSAEAVGDSTAGGGGGLEAAEVDTEEVYVVLDVPTAWATPDAVAALSSVDFDHEVCPTSFVKDYWLYGHLV
jgi:protein gp37